MFWRARHPDEFWRGEKGRDHIIIDGKHRNLILRGQSLGKRKPMSRVTFWKILPVSSLFSSYMPPLRPFLCIQTTLLQCLIPPIVRPPSSVRRKSSALQLTADQCPLLVSLPAAHMQVCTPPPDLCGWWYLDWVWVGGAKDTAPPAVVLSPSSRRQASPASVQVHAYARRSISLLILAVPVSLLSASPLPLSPYNRTCPSTLPPNGRVFS